MLYSLWLESEQTECAVSLHCVVVYILAFFFFLLSNLQEIVVKIVTKKLGEKYHKKKAVVKVKGCKWKHVALVKLFWYQMTSEILFHCGSCSALSHHWQGLKCHLNCTGTYSGQEVNLWICLMSFTQWSFLKYGFVVHILPLLTHPP